MQTTKRGQNDQELIEQGSYKALTVLLRTNQSRTGGENRNNRFRTWRVRLAAKGSRLVFRSTLANTALRVEG